MFCDAGTDTHDDAEQSSGLTEIYLRFAMPARSRYAKAVAAPQLGQSYGAMVHACMVNSLREEVPHSPDLHDEGTSFVKVRGTGVPPQLTSSPPPPN
eukprot:COSAG01_NODE_2799_length_7053_cov_21.482456_9_plen_97_part_00